MPEEISEEEFVLNNLPNLPVDGFTSVDFPSDMLVSYNVDNLLLGNEIIFNANNEEVLRICQDGNIHYHGRIIANDMEIVNGLREFLAGHNLIKPIEYDRGAFNEQEYQNKLKERNKNKFIIRPRSSDG